MKNTRTSIPNRIGKPENFIFIHSPSCTARLYHKTSLFVLFRRLINDQAGTGYQLVAADFVTMPRHRFACRLKSEKKKSTIWVEIFIECDDVDVYDKQTEWKYTRVYAPNIHRTDVHTKSHIRQSILTLLVYFSNPKEAGKLVVDDYDDARSRFYIRNTYYTSKGYDYTTIFTRVIIVAH